MDAYSEVSVVRARCRLGGSISVDVTGNKDAQYQTDNKMYFALIMMLMPRLMNGLLKSMTFSLAAMMVRGAIARSASYNVQ